MGRKSATVWDYDGYQLMGGSESPYYLIRFAVLPEIIKEPLVLKTGDTLYLGDTLAFLGSKKTSAGFHNLHPMAPFLFRYAGMFKDGDIEYVLWETGVKPDKENEAIFYAHAVLKTKGVVRSLVFTNRAGSGRVIEAEFFHATHDTIPHDLYPLPYQKEMGWVA